MLMMEKCLWEVGLERLLDLDAIKGMLWAVAYSFLEITSTAAIVTTISSLHLVGPVGLLGGLPMTLSKQPPPGEAGVGVVIKEEMGLQQRIISHILIIHPIQQTTKVQTGGVTEIIHMVLKYISVSRCIFYSRC
jgi:hypothetical protein